MLVKLDGYQPKAKGEWWWWINFPLLFSLLARAGITGAGFWDFAGGGGLEMYKNASPASFGSPSLWVSILVLLVGVGHGVEVGGEKVRQLGSTCLTMMVTTRADHIYGGRLP